jgi:hypothetical protein
MTKDEYCERNNRTVIDVSFEQIRGGKVAEIMEDVYCTPARCKSGKAIFELFQGQLVDLSLDMGNGSIDIGTVSECKWVYKDSSYGLRNSTDSNSTVVTDEDEETDEDDCVETSEKSSNSKRSKSSKSKSSRSGKSSKGESEDSSNSSPKKVKSCKKKKKGSLRTRPRITINDLKLLMFNPFN